MPTALAIEEITDAGAFEVLATRVLRQTDSDYARIEHLGVNSGGKTVKNPLDGFCRIPGSTPSRYVMAAFSTDAANRLERKLLFDHRQSSGLRYADSDDGDLVKAARASTVLRSRDSDSEFVFTFCTNKQPCIELMQAGYAAGKSAGIEVRFLARSAIRDHLDTTRDGQWLRKEHLGIPADRLSLPLLRELAALSVKHYSYELFCPDTHIIETATTRQLASQCASNHSCVNILLGASGSGKSVASYKVFKDFIDKGGVALWLPAEVVSNALSLEAAISTVLQSLYPSLSSDPGRDALTLTASHEVPLLLIIDDINRVTNTAHSVHKLITWHRRAVAVQDSDGSSNQDCRALHLVIPLWNHYWPSISNHHRNDVAVNEVAAHKMSRHEAVRCLRSCSRRQLDEHTSLELVKRLEHDPILIGLWGDLFGDMPTNHLDTEASTLIEEYIERSIQDTSVDGTFLSADCRTAIHTLGSRMLAERELYPTWAKVTEWLDQSQVGAIRQLCVSERVCRVVRRNNIDRFEFRHDRLLETAIGTPLRACLSEIDKNRDLLADPFFTDTIARAIIESREAVDLIPKLRLIAPLSVLRALSHVTEPDTKLATVTVGAAKEWLGEATTNAGTPPELVFAASQILETTPSQLVLEATEDIKNDRRFSGVRLVNGDAVNGKFLVNSRGFYPSARAPFIEATIENACRLHLNRLCNSLAADLENGLSSKEELRAALTLAGYLGANILAVPVLKAWKHDEGNHCLLEALWASMRCSTSPEITLSPMLDSWANLSDEEDQHGRSDRNRFLTTLEFCMRHGLNESVVAFLVKRAEQDDRLLCLTTLLRSIDHPLAATFVAKEVALVESNVQFSPWASYTRNKWDPLMRNGYRLSETSKTSILRLWEQSNEPRLKESYLTTWVATTHSVEELASLPQEFATLPNVLWRRALLGDLSISDLVLEYVEQDMRWWSVVPKIWTDAYFEVLERALLSLEENTPSDFSGGVSNDHYHLSFLMRDIRSEVSEQLLLKHWNVLKFSRLFVQVALYVGGKPLLSVADTVIRTAPRSWKPFKNLESLFGFNTLRLKDRLVFRHIEALLPHVKCIPDDLLMDVAEWMVDHGREDYFRDQIEPEIALRVEAQRTEGEDSYIYRLAKRRFPTNADLLDELSTIEGEENPSVWPWCHFATERGDSPERIRNVLRTWWSVQPSPRRLRIIAEIVMELGYREDVTDLRRYQDEHGDDSSKTFVDGATFWVQYRTLS